MSKQVAALAVNLRDTKDSELSAQEPMSMLDRDKIDWLLDVLQSYQRLFDGDRAYCDHFGRYNSIIYILDFDVLRRYLEAEDSEPPEDFAVAHLFRSSAQPYALPTGACIEFLNWLTRDVMNSRGIGFLGNLSREQFVVRCAQILRIQNVESMEMDEALDEICNQIAKKQRVVKRLIEFLDNPRFKGTVSAADDGDKQIIQSILSEIPRKNLQRDRERVVDERDALNLSIAIKSVRVAIETRKREPDADVTVYVLVSQTRAIFDFARNLQEMGPDKPDFVREIEEWLGSVPSRGKKILPLIRPRNAFHVERLGLYENPQKARHRIINLRDKFNSATKHLMASQNLITYAAQQQGERGLYDYVISQIEDHGEVVGEDLRSIATRLFIQEPRLRMLEQERAQSISVEYSRNQGEPALQDRESRLRQESVKFMHMLSQLLLSLEKVDAVSYDWNIDPGHPCRPFDEIRILQRISGAAAKGQEIITGEVYYGSGTEKNQSLYYVMRWPIVCLEDSFIESLRRIVVPMYPMEFKRDVDDPDESWTPMTVESEYWNEGVVVYTSQGVFGGSLAPFLANDQGWYHLRYRQLYQKFKSTRVSAGKGGEGLDSEAPFTLLQYRVNTGFGDFLFDIEPAEGDLVRYLTAVSRYNISECILAMFDYTATQAVVSPKLGRLLTSELSVFPALPPQL
jgi:hypothetical protein